MHELTNHYDILKVSENAPPEIIKAAYRTLSQKHHPDKNPGDCNAAEVMQKINQAHDILSNAELRKEHDKQLENQNKKRLRKQFLEMQAQARASVEPPPPPPPPPTPTPTPEPSTAAEQSDITYAKSYPQTRKITIPLISRPLQTVRRARRRHLLFFTILAIALTTIKYPSKKNDETTTKESQSKNTYQPNKQIKKHEPTTQNRNNKHNPTYKAAQLKQNTNTDPLEKKEFRYSQNLTPSYSLNRIQKKSQEQNAAPNTNTNNTQNIERIITWPGKN